MRIRRGWGVCGLIGSVALVACGIGWWVIQSARRIPESYARVLEVAPEVAQEQGDLLERQIVELHNATREDETWEFEFTEAQINGWLATDLPTKFPDALPDKISDPRVILDEASAQLAFKYRVRGMTGVVIAEFDIFCTENPNEIAVQIKDVRSGVVTLPIGPWLERIGRQVESSTGLTVEWVNQSEQPMALITVPDQMKVFGEDRSVELSGIELQSGAIIIGGRTSTNGLPDQSARQPSPEPSGSDRPTDSVKF